MKIKHILLVLLGLFVIAVIYFLPRMMNQRVYTEYLIQKPGSPAPSNGYPMIVYLHGSGMRGVSVEELKEAALPAHVERQPDFPFFVLLPVCRKHDSWHPKYLLDLVDKVVDEYPIDTSRLYLTGLSMGGSGTWNLAQRSPDTFAAIAPICGRSHWELESIKRLKNTPVWAFHGVQDQVLPFEESEKLVKVLRSIGADVQFTAYQDKGHNVWDETYANDSLYTWFLSKRKK